MQISFEHEIEYNYIYYTVKGVMDVEVDREYGVDGDGRRGWTRTTVEDIDLEVTSEDSDAILPITEEMNSFFSETLTNYFFEGSL